jgi:precorrin-2 dehydrogenase / sirohydrochlorin ferrochelatase
MERSEGILIWHLLHSSPISEEDILALPYIGKGWGEDRGKDRKIMTSYYPIFLNLKNRRCVIVGGGEVAERKVKTLVEQGAQVMVISQNLTKELETMAGQGMIQIMLRDYSPGDLRLAVIAIAATDNTQVNHQIAEDGKQWGVLVNVVDDPEASDFIVPSQFSRGDVVIAISTGGHSPALARKIRTELESHISPEYEALVQLVSQVRAELKEKGSSPTGDDWQEALDLKKLLLLLREGCVEEAKNILLNKLI